jgi:glycosyltransferase involved in cell wall biosynthesis
MNLVFITEARFIKDAKGDIYGPTSFNRDLWNLYLNIFPHVYIMARVFPDEKYKGKEEYLSSANGVTFIELPYYVGLEQFLSKYFRLKKKIQQAVNMHKNDHYICRVPGTISNIAIKELKKINKNYAVEVVGDPDDVFSKGALKHPLRPLIRKLSTANLKKVVNGCSAALYVTEHALQKKYLAENAHFITSATNVMLKENELLDKPKLKREKGSYQIISIGTLDQMYKAPDIVLKAIKQLRDKGMDCRLTWLGGGKYLNEMKLLSKSLKIEDVTEFKGNVSKQEVNYYLEKSDLFVLVSRTEGLPRVIVEAMAKGLPCIGTNVGGIPELLDKNVLIPKNSVSDLVSKISEILNNADYYYSQSERNLTVARKYTETILNKKRESFYRFIINNL